MTCVRIPELALVVLIGPSGSGKSTLARKHFRPTEVLSSDVCRGLVSDDENDQSVTDAAFDVLHYIAAKRLLNRRLVVVDATNVQPESRRSLVALARAHHVLPVAIVLDVPAKLCEARNAERPDRAFGPHVVRQQLAQLRRSRRNLKREGFRQVVTLESPEEIDALEIVRERMWNDRREDSGPFDLIGDVHGCREELETLLADLGYARGPVEGPAPEGAYAHPDGRRVIFLGDLVDRGPDSPGVLRIAMDMCAAGTALAIPGNHEAKLIKKLRGKSVRVSHGLAETLEQLEREPPELSSRVLSFVDGLVSHLILDDGKLVVAHAGLKEELQGRASGAVRAFCLYGETTGETDEYGLPVRHDWARSYRGRAAVVYGHTPVPTAAWVNNTLCVDTGCVFGGRLTALRWPERELVSVAAAREYYEPKRPLNPEAPADTRPVDLLDIGDVQGKHIVETRFDLTVTIREDNATAALEVMSRFAVDPRWLIHLPPTMSPTETTDEPGLLEHPKEAFAYFRGERIEQVVCQEKHMGSRAIVVVCRDEAAARRRFRVSGDTVGVVTTRTGRPFFSDAEVEGALLDRVRGAVEAAGLWQALETDWLCLDCELMPWSAKAQELLVRQYAATAAAARGSLSRAVAVLEQAQAMRADVDDLLARHRARRDAVERFAKAYGGYCWPVETVADLKLAPFHLLASEGHVHTDQSHLWHMDMAIRLARADKAEVLIDTRHTVVELADPASEARATAWWRELTDAGGEGMVVKPLGWLHAGPKGMTQPALKVRGPEYLRIIYGPEYLAEEHLPRLRKRAVQRKRSLAMRELRLGLEALHRFVDGEPTYRVHECVFGVLALESEPIDPRL